jgi:hypothetical protein
VDGGGGDGGGGDDSGGQWDRIESEPDMREPNHPTLTGIPSTYQDS